MKRFVRLVWVGCSLFFAGCFNSGSSAGPQVGPPPSHYPQADRGTVVDHYQGSQGPVDVADPYRWMEDLDSTQTRQWTQSENALSTSYLQSLASNAPIKNRLSQLWNYERYSIPVKVAGHYFFQKNDGLQNQPVLYVSDSLAAVPRPLIDPNPLSADGTTTIDVFRVSPDGKYLAYGLQDKGTDWRRWHIRVLGTNVDLPEELLWSKYGDPVAWTRDSKGFYYNRFPEPGSGTDLNLNHRIYYHVVGTAQSDDVLIYERPQNPDWYLTPAISDDGRFLVINMGPADNTSIFVYRDLTVPGSPLTELMKTPKDINSFIGSHADTLFLETNLNASNYKVVAVNPKSPENWVDVIPESSEAIGQVTLLRDQLYVSYLKDAHSEVRVFDLQGKPIRTIDFPEKYVTADGFTDVSDDGETFYSSQSFIEAPAVYAYNIATGVSSLFKKPSLSFDPGQYETTQISYVSKDGTRVPMFVTAKKGVKLDGNNPTLLYGYGGFNISMTPSFSPLVLVWLERGGIYALPNIRGGGEYGESWHRAGTKLNKQNVFDDFIASAEFLVSHHYTSTPKLAIRGGSNGGLLVGACLMQRPDLFGAALAEVGVMDMLRFNKFSSGRYWVDDYGSPEPLPGQDPASWDPREFDNLYRISPYHSALRAQGQGIHYPPTLITTSDHDDRVVPLHSFKFAAALQAAQAGSAPTLIRIETNAGHGSGLPVTKAIQKAADELSFVEGATKGR